MFQFSDHVTKPVRRSRLRRRLGKLFYQAKRSIEWLTASGHFARSLNQNYLDNVVTTHRSLLLRPLKDVDMWLQHNKVVNLKLAIRHMDGLIIRPGETFSLWYLVGEPSRRKGYLPGLVLNQGKIETGIGGGLCQLGNLLCWMSLHTPLRIKERHRHGFDVFPDTDRRIPFGSGATLVYNYIDLQLENTTENTFQLRLYITDDYLNGEIRSEKLLSEKYEVFEDSHKIVHQVWGGYTRHNQIKRKVVRGDKTEVEIVFENHAVMMYEPLLTH